MNDLNFVPIPDCFLSIFVFSSVHSTAPRELKCRSQADSPIMKNDI